MILFYFINSALVNNQTNADTSLHPGFVALIVALIICVFTALIILLVVFWTKRSPGVYKTYFFHLSIILQTHFDHIFFRKDRKKYLLLTEIGKTTVKD